MGDARIKVRVTPRTSRNEVTGIQDGVLHVRVTAAPVDGAANAAITKLIADHIGVAKGRISLVSGAKGREKTFAVDGLTPDELQLRLTSKEQSS